MPMFCFTIYEETGKLTAVHSFIFSCLRLSLPLCFSSPLSRAMGDVLPLIAKHGSTCGDIFNIDDGRRTIQKLVFDVDKNLSVILFVCKQ